MALEQHSQSAITHASGRRNPTGWRWEAQLGIPWGRADSLSGDGGTLNRCVSYPLSASSSRSTTKVRLQSIHEGPMILWSPETSGFTSIQSASQKCRLDGWRRRHHKSVCHS